MTINLEDSIPIPLVSIIMPVFNAELYLRESIESILNQTITDFELLILDDCSTDNSLKIAKSYNDHRIKIYESMENRGIVFQLNKGIALSKAFFLARMDADDISLPTRLEKQISYLARNPDVQVCGSWLETFGDLDSEIWTLPEHNADIAVNLIFGNSMFHPTVMFRVKGINIKYSNEYKFVEDYELWTRLLKEGVKFGNVPEVLLRYRRHSNQSSTASRSLQISNSDKIILRQLSHYGLNSEETLKYIKALRGEIEVSSLMLPISYWINKLLLMNTQVETYEAIALETILEKKWRYHCLQNLKSFDAIVAFYVCLLRRKNSKKEQLKFVIKSLRKVIKIKLFKDFSKGSNEAK